MDQQRLLELALNELQRQKTEIDEEIETLQNELKGTGPNLLQTGLPAPAGTQRRRRRTPAERRAQAQRMKEYWAQKRAQAKKPTPAGTKLRTKTAAQKKALSLAMKEAWKKRKAAAKAQAE